MYSTMQENVSIIGGDGDSLQKEDFYQNISEIYFTDSEF